MLKALKMGKRRMAAMHMHAACLHATRRGRHGLAWIQQVMRVERGFQGMKGGEFGGRELGAHAVELLHADPMLAADRSAMRKAEPQYVGAQGLDLPELALDRGVVQDEGMEVAIARMEHIGHGQAVAAREGGDLGQDRHQGTSGSGP